MLILALDTSGKVASCALLRDGEVISYTEKDSMLDHSSTLLPVCREMLEKSGLGLGDVDVFAATIGPGSFTGVRIGTAAVKGFAWAAEKPCAGVSTLLSAAYNYGGTGRFCQRLLARQDEYYYAVFEKDQAGVHRLTEDTVGSGAETQQPGCEIVTGGQNAAGTAMAAYAMAQAGALTDCHSMNPAYLRITQAERMKQEKEKQR